MSEQAFSAEVSLTLTVNKHELQLSHVGPDFFVLQDVSKKAPTGMAELTIVIDEHVETTAVRVSQVPDGVPGRFAYTPLAEPVLSVATATQD